MRPRRVRPQCRECERDARKGSLFCSQRCAAAWAETVLLGYEETWCENHLEWYALDYDAPERCTCGESIDGPGHVHVRDWSCWGD